MRSHYPSIQSALAAKLALLLRQTVLRYLPVRVFMPS